MLNVSAIPLTDISPIWDDGFLSLSKNLLSAVTLDDFIKKLNRIQPCFRQVDRVNLILNLGTGRRRSSTTWGAGAGSPHLPQGRSPFSREQAIVLPASRFRHRCEQLASTPVYDGLHSYCQLPITTARSHLGGWSSSAARPMPSRWRPWPS